MTDSERRHEESMASLRELIRRKAAWPCANSSSEPDSEPKRQTEFLLNQSGRIPLSSVGIDPLAVIPANVGGNRQVDQSRLECDIA